MHRLSVGLVALALVGCSKHHDAAGVGSGSGSALPKSNKPPGRLPGGPTPPAGGAQPIALPKSDGTPPLALTAALPVTTIKRLGAMQFPGFDVPPPVQHGQDIRIDLSTHDRPILMLKVFIKPCLDKCTPMTDEAWTAELPRLKNNVPEALRDLPDLTWEHGWADLHGVKAFYTFQAGQAFTKDSAGNSQGGWTDAYTLHFNNGFELIEVVAQYADDPLQTKQDMLNLAPEADMQRLALAFADAYTHAWVPTADELAGK